MSDVIAEYQRWKQQGGDLRAKARVAMESRFRELLTEAVKVAEEYHADFGATLKPPVIVTSFRFKSGKAKKAAAPGAKKTAAAAPPTPPAKPDAKVTALQKKLATARKKLESAKAAGQSTRDLDDRIYEIEDELRLAMDAG
ncbi:MAG TPA: hypothetical protein VGK29_20725 [Paludibaculum sp.]